MRALGGATSGTGNLNMYASTIGLMPTVGVGIGTTVPQATLDVGGNILSRQYNAPGNQGAYIGWNRSGSQGETNFMCQRGGGSGGYSFEIWNSSNILLSTPLYIIGSSGNVGIGTTNPGAPLYVKYGTNADSTSQPSGTWASIIYNATNAAGANGLLVKTNWYNNGAGNYIFQCGNDLVGGAYTPFFTVMGGGNVGIGTTIPQTTLHVNGSIKCGTIASTSFTFTASSGATTIISNSSSNGYAGNTVILITVNGLNLSVSTFGGSTVTASAYVSWDYGAPSYANVYGMVANRGDISITASGYGVNFNVPTINSNFYISYSVTILRMS